MQSNHGMVRCVRGALAQALHRLQQEGMQGIIDRATPFLIFNLLFDETKLKVKVQHEAVASSSVLWCHGLLRFLGPGNSLCEEEVVMPPLVLQQASADGILGGIRRSLPQPLTSLFQNVGLGCLQVTSDAASANQLLIKHVARTLPDNVALLPPQVLPAPSPSHNLF